MKRFTNNILKIFPDFSSGNRKKKIVVTCISLALLLLMLVSPFIAAAQSAPVSESKGFATNFTKGLAAGPLLIILAICLLIQYILSYILSFAGYILDNVFVGNLVTVPSNLAVVQIGWTTVRNLVNATFILIVLWIALTIIFDWEGYGGRKLLVRVVLVAILINFSLAMVSLVWAFSNEMAKAFYNKINLKDGDLAGFIVGHLKIHTVVQSIDDGQLQANKQQRLDIDAASKRTASISSFDSVKTQVLSSLGAPPAQAVTLAGAAGCAIGAVLGGFILNPLAGCIAVGLVAAIFDATIGISAGISNAAAQQIINVSIGSIFFIIMIIAFFYASIALLTRIIIIIFISVFAPAAFLMLAIPGGSGKKYWDLWLSTLINWAFFAPIFYFLMYLTLFMAQKFDEVYGTNSAIQTQASKDADRILQLFVIAGFLIFTSRYSRKMANEFGGVAVDLGKKLTGLVVGGTASYLTGGASLAVAGLARRAAPSIERGIQRVSNVPILNKIAAPATRRAVEFLENQKSSVKKVASDASNLTPERNLALFRASLDSIERLGRAMALKDKGKFDSLSPGERDSVLRMAENLALKGEFLNVRPDLATTNDAEPRKRNAHTEKDAVRAQAQSIPASQIADVSTELLKGTGSKNDAAREGILINNNFTPRILATIASKDLQAAQSLVDHIDTLYDQAATLPPQQRQTADAALQTLDNRFRNYFRTVLSGEHGLKAPQRWAITPQTTTTRGGSTNSAGGAQSGNAGATATGTGAGGGNTANTNTPANTSSSTSTPTSTATVVPAAAAATTTGTSTPSGGTATPPPAGGATTP